MAFWVLRNNNTIIRMPEQALRFATGVIEAAPDTEEGLKLLQETRTKMLQQQKMAAQKGITNGAFRTSSSSPDITKPRR